MKFLFITGLDGVTFVDPGYTELPEQNSIITSAWPRPLSEFATELLKSGAVVEVGDVTLELKDCYVKSVMYQGDALKNQRVLH